MYDHTFLQKLQWNLTDEQATDSELVLSDISRLLVHLYFDLWNFRHNMYQYNSVTTSQETFITQQRVVGALCTNRSRINYFMSVPPLSSSVPLSLTSGRLFRTFNNISIVSVLSHRMINYQSRVTRNNQNCNKQNLRYRGRRIPQERESPFTTNFNSPITVHDRSCLCWFRDLNNFTFESTYHHREASSLQNLSTLTREKLILYSRLQVIWLCLNSIIFSNTLFSNNLGWTLNSIS